MYLTLMFLTALLLPTPVIAGLMRRRMSPYRVVVEGAIAGVAGALFVMILASAAGESIAAVFQESIRYIAQTLAGDPNIAQLLGDELTMSERVEILTRIYGQAADLLPSTIGIFSAVGAYIEYLILSRIIKPEGTGAVRMSPFREFSLPGNFIIVWAGLFLLSWILTTIKSLPGDALYANINALFDFVFSLQGMSVIFMFCYKKRAPKAIAVIIILFLLFSGFGNLVLVILGFADIIFRLKKRIR